MGVQIRMPDASRGVPLLLQPAHRNVRRHPLPNKCDTQTNLHRCPINRANQPVLIPFDVELSNVYAILVPILLHCLEQGQHWKVLHSVPLPDNSPFMKVHISRKTGYPMIQALPVSTQY